MTPVGIMLPVAALILLHSLHRDPDLSSQHEYYLKIVLYHFFYQCFLHIAEIKEKVSQDKVFCLKTFNITVLSENVLMVFKMDCCLFVIKKKLLFSSLTMIISKI